MNDKINAQTMSITALLIDRIPHASKEITELIRASMELAYTEGELNGIRQAQACIETTRAVEKARTA